MFECSLAAVRIGGKTNYLGHNTSTFDERNSSYTKPNFIFRFSARVQEVTGNAHAQSSDTSDHVSRNACKIIIQRCV